MSEWTDEAMELWADYLDAVRTALRGVDPSEVDEVLRDLEDHATRAFAGAPQMVSAAEMRALTDRLGAPAAFAEAAHGTAAAPRPPGDSASISSSRRNEGLVLAYSSLALLVLGALVPSLLAGAIPLAFIVARLALRHPSMPPGSVERRLLYPALGVGSAVLAGVMALWPLMLVIPVAAIGGPLEAVMRERGVAAAFGTATYWIAAWGIGAIATAAWWLILRRLMRRHREIFSRLFQPFFDRVMRYD